MTRTSEEKLVRMVRTETLSKCLSLWNGMSTEDRKKFCDKTDKDAYKHMEIIERELRRRDSETGLDILAALINGEQR